MLEKLYICTVLKRWTIRAFSYVLLCAIVHIAVPFQEIFHTHHAAFHHQSDEGTSFHTYENPCCKPVKYFHKVAAILSQQHFTFLTTTYNHKQNFYTCIYSAPLFRLNNKAPPVVLA